MDLSRRLSGLLAHVAAGGPEGENARRALDKLVERFPEYRWALDGGAPVTLEVRCSTAAHRTLAAHVAKGSCCLFVLSVAPGEKSPRAWFEGPEGAVRQAEERFFAASDRLDFVLEYVGVVFCEALGVGDEDELPAEGEEDVLADGSWEAEELARLTRVAVVGAHVSLVPFRALARRLVDLVAPLPRRLQIGAGEDVAWDDPKLSFGDFVRSWRLRHPHSTLTDELLQGEYRFGRRMDPLTGRLKLVPGLERPWGTPLDGRRRKT